MLERKTVDQNGRKGHSMATSNVAQKKWKEIFASNEIGTNHPSQLEMKLTYEM